MVLGEVLGRFSEVAVVTEADCGTARAIRKRDLLALLERIKGLLVLYWKMKEMVKRLLSWSLQF